MSPLQREVAIVVLVAAGVGLIAISLIDWIAYQNFLLSLVWL
jgi:hypothetical protein